MWSSSAGILGGKVEEKQLLVLCISRSVAFYFREITVRTHTSYLPTTLLQPRSNEFSLIWDL
jgi:hypothetical protein